MDARTEAPRDYFVEDDRFPEPDEVDGGAYAVVFALGCGVSCAIGIALGALLF